jgi:molybdate transport system substrate-binding protein
MMSMLSRRALVILALLLAVGGAGCRSRRAKGQVTVAAASDLAKAFEEVGKAFQKKTGIKPVFRFGSSGLLAQQVRELAPFDVYASANVAFVDQVIESGACLPDSRQLYAVGRIVVWSRNHQITSLAELAEPRFHKLSISHPEHAPYGKAAKEALESVGVWDQVKGKVVFGENVRQTLQWAQTGDVDASIVALSLATVTEGGNMFAIDEKLHQPLLQALAVCKHGGAADNGRAFAAFVSSPEGVAIMRQFGFALPR